MAGTTPPRLPGDRYNTGELRRIGRLTQTWSGWDTRLERTVILHVLRPELHSDEQLAHRLASRLREASRIDHPGVARIYDVIGEGVVGVVCEHTDPEDLRRRVASSGVVSPSLAIDLATRLAVSIDALHSSGMTHGALTLSSASFTDDDRLVITDLGTGGATDGTGDETVRGDIAGLAAMVHELVVGRPPHTAGGTVEVDPSVPAAFAGPLDDALLHGRYPTAEAFVAALAATSARSEVPQSFASAERRWLVPAAVVLAVGLVLVLVGSVLGRTQAGRTIIDSARGVVGLEATPVATTDVVPTTDSVSTTTAPTLLQVAVDRITDFDPEGDGLESPTRLVLINDGDPSRGWHTELYTTNDFGNLKSGVGLIVEIDTAAQLTDLIVRTPTRGWSVEVYYSGGPPSVVADWGDPIAAASNISGDVTMVLDEATTPGSMLLWITDLGPGPEFRVTITDIELLGQPQE